MIQLIIVWICIGLVFIFNGFIENMFIILSTILILNIIKNKKYLNKNIFISLVLSYIILNITVTVFLKQHIDTIDILIDEEKEKTAVILVYDGEDLNYNVDEKVNEIFEVEGYKSYLNMIGQLNKYKKYYETIGTSNFKDDSSIISRSLDSKLGDDYIVVNGYLDTAPYFENVISQAISSGYKNIIICPMFVTEGIDYGRVKSRFNKMDIERFNLNIEITDVFYKSNILAKSYKDEILNNIGSRDIETGVLLIGLQNENNIEQDILFREKIKDYILSEKNKDIQIKLPLLENNKKDIIKSGEELLEYGIDILYIVMPTTVVENIHIKGEVQKILKELKLSETRIHYIDPLSKTDAIVGELYKQISLLKSGG